MHSFRGIRSKQSLHAMAPEKALDADRTRGRLRQSPPFARLSGVELARRRCVERRPACTADLDMIDANRMDEHRRVERLVIIEAGSDAHPLRLARELAERQVVIACHPLEP